MMIQLLPPIIAELNTKRIIGVVHFIMLSASLNRIVTQTNRSITRLANPNAWKVQKTAVRAESSVTISRLAPSANPFRLWAVKGKDYKCRSCSEVVVAAAAVLSTMKTSTSFSGNIETL